MTEHLPVLIPVSFLLAAMVAPLVGAWRDHAAYWVVLASTVWVSGLSLYGLWYTAAEGAIHYELGGWPSSIGIEYILDPLAAFFASVIAVIAALVLVHSRKVIRVEEPGKEIPYYGVVALLLAGLAGIVVTGDIFNLFVFLEISSMASYALIGMGGKRAPVAAFRYLLLGTVGASFYLLGVGFLFLQTATLNMGDMAAILPYVLNEPSVIVGLALILVGMGVKMALYPMHGWLPDAYTYAASPTSALIAPMGTKIAAYVIIRILFFVFSAEYVSRTLPYADILAWLSAAGIIAGSILAISQKEIKRLLAYSSVAQIGYIGLGIGLANPLGLIGALLHVLNHALMKSLLFLVAANLRAKVGHSDIPKLDASLRRKMPWTMAGFTVGALSMIGIPPTAGFFSKWYLVLGAIDKNAWVFVAVLIISSLLNAVYFFRVLEKMYLRDPAARKDASEEKADMEPRRLLGTAEVSWSMLSPVLVLTIGLFVAGFLNAWIVEAFIKGMVPF